MSIHTRAETGKGVCVHEAATAILLRRHIARMRRLHFAPLFAKFVGQDLHVAFEFSFGVF